jgi:hypothetical protein
MLVTRPGWLGDRINNQARSLELGVQHVFQDVVFPLEGEVKARQRKRGPTAATLAYGEVITRLKDDDRLSWPRVIDALERQHTGWAQVRAYLSARRSPAAYLRLISWAKQKRRQYRRHSQKHT